MLFDVNQSVIVTATIKNIQKLIIKVYEINTENYWNKNFSLKSFDSAINLEGLIS